MSVRKTEAELRKAQMVKTIRAAVRLSHSLEADAELNETIPEAEKQFDLSLQRGVLPDPSDIIRQLGIE